MSIRLLLSFAFIAAWMNGSRNADAADRREIVRRAKVATVLLVDDLHQYGSAVCIDEGGLLLSSAEIGNRYLTMEPTAIINPGQPDQRKLKAKVLQVGAHICLLQTEHMPQIPALDLGHSNVLAETSEIYALGYPFGNAIGATKGAYPEVSVNVGRVTALRTSGTSLNAIQIDVPLNPGNEGGPLLDSEGKVVGVIEGGLGESKIGVAFPIEEAFALFATPRVSFEPAPVPYDNRHKPTRLVIRARGVPGEDLKVRLALRCDLGPERIIDATYEAGAFVANVTPIPEGQEAQHVHYILTVTAPTLAAGSPNRAPRSPNQIQLQGEISFALPERDVAKALEQTDKLRIALPGHLAGLVTGGGGRFLLLRMDEGSKLAIFDLNSLKIAGTVPLPEPDAIVAAGAKDFYIIRRRNRTAQRWGLEELKPGPTLIIPVYGAISAAAMGDASNGPMLLHWDNGKNALLAGELALLDLDSLKVTAVDPAGFQQRTDKVRLRAAPDGSAFGLWSDQYEPEKAESLELRNGAIERRFNGNANWWYVTPGPGGALLYTGSDGAHGLDLAKLKTGPPANPMDLDTYATIPTSLPGYFVSLPTSRREMSGVVRDHPLAYAAGGEKPLAELPLLPEMIATDWVPSAVDLTREKRLFFRVREKLLVTVPPSNDCLVLRHFDLYQAMKSGNRDYLCADFGAPAPAKAGQAYRMPLNVLHRQGDVKYELKGPPGMSINADGVLLWNTARAGNDTDVTIEIRDGAGQTISLPLRILVR